VSTGVGSGKPSPQRKVFFSIFKFKNAGFHEFLSRKIICGQKPGPGGFIDPMGVTGGGEDVKSMGVENLADNSTPQPPFN